ncbi:hypothetical protein N2152v2_009651 [Parachlorella kessleri]
MGSMYQWGPQQRQQQHRCPCSTWPPRPVRLQTSILLMLGLLGYMWVTASRSLLAEHTRPATDTSGLRAGTTRGGPRAPSRSLREAAAAVAAAAWQTGPAAEAAVRAAAARDVILLAQGPRPAGGVTVAGSTAGLAGGGAPGLTQAAPVISYPAQFGQCRGPSTNETVPHLVSVRRWWSSKGRQGESITLVTQLSLERLDMLENQCSVWPDAIAAVVYAPTLGGRLWSAEDPSLAGQRLGVAQSRLDAFHGRMEAQGRCTLDLELASEDFRDEGEVGLYPFNAARNRALMLAGTEALLLLDADFVPPTSLAAAYQASPRAYQELLAQLRQGQTVVLPAFETASGGAEGRALALAAAQRGKAFVVGEYAAGRLLGFQMRQYEPGHAPTDYARWSAGDSPYTVQYAKGYEPYVLISRRFVPWYDERFRGYGRDKIQHLTHLAGLNVTFSVHPAAFVVHVPHRKAPTFRATRSSGQWDKLYKLYVEVQRDVRAQRFLPVVSFPHRCTNNNSSGDGGASGDGRSSSAGSEAGDQQGLHHGQLWSSRIKE